MTSAMEMLMNEIRNELKSELKAEILAELSEMQKTEKVWMNKKELAAYLGMSPNTLNKYLREHPNFPVREMAGVKSYNARRVDEFIEIVHTMKK